MKLERLELRGFMRFTEPVTLDLTDVPSGILAVVGENGAGKSTLLDAGLAAPFLQFPSRAGALADYATGRDAYIDARYTIEGRGTFRARVNVDAVKRDSDAVLEDGHGRPLNDGKVSTFKPAVAAVFPPKELLLASAFAAQNRAGSFVTLDKKGRKDLFTALLGLKHYESMAETARRCLQVVDGGRVRLEAQREAIARDTADAIHDELQARANRLQAQGGAAEIRKRDLAQQIEGIQFERVGLAEQVEAHVASQERVRSLTQTLATHRAGGEQLDREQRTAMEDRDRELARLTARHSSALAALDLSSRRGEETHAAALMDLDERVANNERLVKDADEIRTAVAAKAEADRLVEEFRGHERTAVQQFEAARELVLECGRQVREAEIGYERLQEHRQRVAAQAATLQTVPCGGAGDFASCRFLTDAAAAVKLELPSLEQQSELLHERRTTLEEATTTQEAQQQRVTELRSKLRDAEAIVKTVAAKAALAPRIEAATSRIEECQRQRAAAIAAAEQRAGDAEHQRAAAIEQHTADVEACRTRLELTTTTIGTRRAELQHAIETTERELEAAQVEADRTSAARARMDVLETELAGLRSEATRLEATLATVAAQREQLQRERVAFATKRRLREDVEARLAEVGDEQLAWQVCAKAFGRDGLPTLEIDAAGPTVSHLTNDLLSVCFGPRFTVELVTQEDKADGKGTKEAFDLKVYDNQAGGDVRSIGDLSGGERVIVEEALRAAIAIFVNSRNEMPIRTLWRDETTGALDPENAVRYVAMLRRLQELGGYHHILFITHNEEAAALADARIVVADGHVELRQAA